MIVASLNQEHTHAQWGRHEAIVVCAVEVTTVLVVFSLVLGMFPCAPTCFQAFGCAPSLAASIESDFVSIAARGVSMIIASGDQGAGPSCSAVEADVSNVGTVLLSSFFSEELCCTLALELHANWSLTHLPITECNSTGFVAPPTLNVGIKGSSTVTLSANTALACCQSLDSFHVGWTWNSSSLVCQLFEKVRPGRLVMILLRVCFISACTSSCENILFLTSMRLNWLASTRRTECSFWGVQRYLSCLRVFSLLW